MDLLHALRVRLFRWSQRRFTDGRMIGLWREIIDCVKRDLYELATTSILLSSQLASESDTHSSPRRPRCTTRQKCAQDKQTKDAQYNDSQVGDRRGHARQMTYE